MSDKSYRVTLTITTDATVYDKTARANADAIDSIVEKLLAEHEGSAITVTATTGEIVTVRENSDKPRAKRGAAVADELAALKAKVEAMGAQPLAAVVEVAALTGAERAALDGSPGMAEMIQDIVMPGRRVKANAHTHDADDAA